MAVSRGSYPHPVLDASDDVASVFEVLNVAVAPTVDFVEVRFEVRNDDPTLTSALSDGRARLSFRWRCGATLATGELTPEEDGRTPSSTRYVAVLDQQTVRDSVTVEVRALAASDLTNFKWEREHPDYGGSTFDLNTGDILADGGQFTFKVDKLYDPLNPPIGSCFHFVGDPSLRRGIRLDFIDDDVVTVKFPEKDMPGLSAMSSQPVLQIATVVLPALMETISFIKNASDDEDGEDLSDRVWARTITGLVEKQPKGFDNQVIDIAQRILEHPINNVLEHVLNATEDDE